MSSGRVPALCKTPGLLGQRQVEAPHLLLLRDSRVRKSSLRDLIGSAGLLKIAKMAILERVSREYAGTNENRRAGG